MREVMFDNGRYWLDTTSISFIVSSDFSTSLAIAAASFFRVSRVNIS
jgi:hypothetical protein